MGGQRPIAKRTFGRTRNGFKGGRGGRSMSRIPRPMKSTSYDGIYYAKINISRPLLFNQTNDIAFMAVHWGSKTSLSSTTYMAIRQSSEFTTLATAFNFWKVHGVKIKIFPATSLSGATDRVYFETQTASFPDREVPLTTADAQYQK